MTMSLNRTTAKVSSRAAIAESLRGSLIYELVQQVAAIKDLHSRREKIPASKLETLVGQASQLMGVSFQLDLLRTILDETVEP
jgi:hypothetical protein